MRSLKQRLILWVVSAVVVLTATAGIAFYLTARAYLVEQFDDELEDRFELLASSIEYEEGTIDTGFEDIKMDDFGEEDDEDEDEDEDEEGGEDEDDPVSYLRINTRDRVAYRSPTLGDLGVLPTSPTDEPVWLELPDGRRGRAYCQSFVPRVDLGDTLFEWAANAMALDAHVHDELVMSLARDTRKLDEALANLRIGLFGAGAGLAALMSCVVAYGVRRGMIPVDEMARRLAKMDIPGLADPIAPELLPAELQPIVEQYNTLLARVGKAYARERGFSADIAHELRTPLAGLRTTLDVALAKPRTPEQAAEVFEELSEITEHMRTLVEALLRLAALEAGTSDNRVGSVNLDDEILRVWRLVIHNGVAERVFKTNLCLHADAPIGTRPALLELILRNVLHNAAAYVDPGGIVTIASEMSAASTALTVSNTGSTVSEVDAPRVFDRFWRADTSRAGTGKHSGLGLALTRSAVHALGGSIQAKSDKGGSFVMTIQLPRM